MKKFVEFLKKNWVPIVVIMVGSILTGILGKIISKVRVWFRVSSGGKELKDYDLYASVLHDALKTSLFDWFVNFDIVKGNINSLESTNEFLELNKRYALKYGKDLRTELKQNLKPEQYSQLLYK